MIQFIISMWLNDHETTIFASNASKIDVHYQPFVKLKTHFKLNFIELQFDVRTQSW